MRVYLFGFASDDFLGRVIVTPDERTVAQLAGQLVAWGLAPERADLSRCATRPATSSIPPPPSPRPGSETVTSSRSSEGDSTVAVWRYAGTLDDIWAGEMRAVNLGAVDVLLCNLDGTLVAYENRCPHLANPLSEGVLG